MKNHTYTYMTTDTHGLLVANTKPSQVEQRGAPLHCEDPKHGFRNAKTLRSELLPTSHANGLLEPDLWTTPWHRVNSPGQKPGWIGL